MRVPRPRAAPPRQPDSLIAPPQLWQHLSVGQQQHVRKILLGVAQQLVAYLPSPSPCEETPHWTWPHDSGHMWEALSPHPSCLEIGLEQGCSQPLTRLTLNPQRP